MEQYAIITDATADLPNEVAKKLNLHIIPMHFELGGNSYYHYVDERELTMREFYTRLRTGENSVTSQINPITLQEQFEELLKQDINILYICFTSGLSGTYNNAKLIAEEMKEKYPGRKLFVVDSLCASVGQGILVYHASCKKQEGASIEEVRDYLEENKLHTCHWFTVDDLYHLKRGGRISAVTATVGTALKIKPVLSLDKEGKLIVVAKVRGNKKGIDYLISRLEKDGINMKQQTIIVGHADNIEAAQQLKEKLLQKNLVKDVIISAIGPIIGTHTGSNMLALAFMGTRNL